MAIIETIGANIDHDMSFDDVAASPEELKNAVLNKLEALDATGAQTGVATYILDKLLGGELGEDAASALEGGIPPGIEEADSPEELLAALLETIGVDPSVLEGLDPLDKPIFAGNGLGDDPRGEAGNLSQGRQSGDVLDDDVVEQFLIDGGFLAANNQGTANIVGGSNVDSRIGNGLG